MKTKLIIEIESPDIFEGVISEEYIGRDDLTKEEKLDIEENRKVYAKDLHDYAISLVERFLKDYEEHFLDEMGDICLEDVDNFEGYRVKVTTTKTGGA